MLVSTPHIPLDALETHFQPIYTLRDGAPLGYEALTRGPAGTPLASPLALFDAAERSGRILELELAAWRTAARAAARQASRVSAWTAVFLNARPTTLLLPRTLTALLLLLERERIAPAQVVLEITEGERIADVAAMRQALRAYRAAGFRLALDDVGAGHAGLSTTTALDVEFLKLDRSLVRGVHESARQRAAVEAMLHLAHACHARVIAEGIEEAGELHTLRELGVPYGQGWFLARPAAMPAGLTSEAQAILATPPATVAAPVRGRGAQAGAPAAPARATEAIRALAAPTPTVPHERTLQDVLGHFDDRAVSGIVVLRQEVPAGLLMRSHVMAVLARPFGRDLFLRREAALAARPDPLIVDATMSVDDVSRLAMGRSLDTLYDDIVVVDDRGALCGSVSVQRLLDAVTDLRVAAARHANPLTGLPGNPAIEREIAMRVERGSACAVLHLDLDNFKAYNDAYGFHRGDVAIRVTAELLAEEIAAAGSAGSFLGHIGGDDFVAVVAPDSVDTLRERIPAALAARLGELYDPVDLQRECILAIDASGVTLRVPLLSISIATLLVDPADERHYASLLDRLSEQKRLAKRQRPLPVALVAT